MNVKNLVLPTAEEAVSVWIHTFGFSRMRPEQLVNYRKNCQQMIAFKGTVMLHKTLPQCRIKSGYLMDCSPLMLRPEACTIRSIFLKIAVLTHRVDLDRVDEPKEDAADQISRPGTETIPLPRLVSSTLYVEGIPSDWTIRKVADIFCRFVGYRKVRLEVTKESMDQVGDPSVVGFVDFADPFCASTAMRILEDKFELHPYSSLRLRFSPS
ncbi:hypothetical protein P8452_01336 [Trifolium repens]|nr:hypothetical protein P8452_01336 [Trifolium repens]